MSYSGGKCDIGNYYKLCHLAPDGPACVDFRSKCKLEPPTKGGCSYREYDQVCVHDPDEMKCTSFKEKCLDEQKNNPIHDQKKRVSKVIWIIIIVIAVVAFLGGIAFGLYQKRKAPSRRFAQDLDSP